MAFAFLLQKKGDRQLIVLELLVATNTFWLNVQHTQKVHVLLYIVLLLFICFFTLSCVLIVAWIAFSYVM